MASTNNPASAAQGAQGAQAQTAGDQPEQKGKKTSPIPPAAKPAAKAKGKQSDQAQPQEKPFSARGSKLVARPGPLPGVMPEFGEEVEPAATAEQTKDKAVKQRAQRAADG